MGNCGSIVILGECQRARPLRCQCACTAQFACFPVQKLRSGHACNVSCEFGRLQCCLLSSTSSILVQLDTKQSVQLLMDVPAGKVALFANLYVQG